MNLRPKFENKKKKAIAGTLKVLAHLIFFFSVCKCVCHMGICLVIERSIMSLIIYIIFHAV